jgi:hypothetical protein
VIHRSHIHSAVQSRWSRSRRSSASGRSVGGPRRSWIYPDPPARRKIDEYSQDPLQARFPDPAQATQNCPQWRRADVRMSNFYLKKSTILSLMAGQLHNPRLETPASVLLQYLRYRRWLPTNFRSIYQKAVEHITSFRGSAAMCATAPALNISLPNGPCADRDCQAAVRTQPWLDRDGERNAFRRPSRAPSDLGGHPTQSGATESHSGVRHRESSQGWFQPVLGAGGRV